MQNDYLRIEDMLSLVSQIINRVKYVVLKKILFFPSHLDVDLTTALGTAMSIVSY